jgi:hypothetical protein
MKRNQWAAALLSLLLFLSGAAVGALAHRYYAATTVSAKTAAETFREHYLTEMKSKLNLTDAQVKQLDAILDDTKAKYKTVRDQFRPQMLAIKNEQISRVKEILNPEQVPVYERLVSEHEKRAREEEARDRDKEQKRQAAPSPSR